MGRTTARFSFRECTSPSRTSRPSVPTNTSCLRCSGPRLLAQLVRLDHVVDLDVVERAEADAALETLPYLRRVVLEPAQRLDRQVVRHDRAVPYEPGLRVADDGPGPDEAACDVAELRGAEDLAHLGGAELHLLELRLEHPAQRELDVVDGLVDHRVVADVDALAV